MRNVNSAAVGAVGVVGSDVALDRALRNVTEARRAVSEDLRLLVELTSLPGRLKQTGLSVEFPTEAAADAVCSVVVNFERSLREYADVTRALYEEIDGDDGDVVEVDDGDEPTAVMLIPGGEA